MYIVIDESPESSKAPSPITETDAGITIDLSDVHLLKEYVPIVVTVEGIFISVSDVQSVKAAFEINVIPSGSITFVIDDLRLFHGRFFAA